VRIRGRSISFVVIHESFPSLMQCAAGNRYMSVEASGRCRYHQRAARPACRTERRSAERAGAFPGPKTVCPGDCDAEAGKGRPGTRITSRVSASFRRGDPKVETTAGLRNLLKPTHFARIQ